MKKIRLLYVEDSPFDSDLVKVHFEENAPEIKILVSEDTEKALDLIRQRKDIDLVLSDMNMLTIDGLEFFKNAISKNIKLPFVFITGNMDEQKAVDVIKLGAYDYVLKQEGYLKKLPEIIKRAVGEFREDEKRLFLNSQLNRLAVSLEQKVKNRTITLMSEIEERRAKEKQLKESLEFNQSLLSIIPFGISIVDQQGNILFFNKQMELLMGKKAVGKKCWEIYCDNNQQCKYCPLSNPIEIGKTNVLETAGLLGGRKIEITHTGMMFRGQKAIMEVFHDITERKRVEEDLISTLDKANEANRLKSVFLANMSHEIRTPMNGIIGFSDLLKETGLRREEQNSYINIIEKSGERMLETINDIIDVSKIEAGQINVSLSLVNIKEQIEEVYNFFKPETQKKGLQFIVNIDLAPHETIIKSDREKIYGVLSNLITNAIKYTPDGSIEIRCSKKGDNIELSVKDTGMGIPADKQKTIFERFAQPEIKDREAYEGWGLGLFITKAYLDLLGGKIWMESDEGRGSQFYFLIPANREKVKSIIKKTEKKPLTQIMNISKKLKVLIAEDDQSADYYLSILMEELNFEIFHAKTGLEALETCRKMDGLDLILMDIKMPVMDGYNTTKQIRKFNNEVVIVAQTAYALIGDREKAIEAGCDDYISKPLNKVELFEIIAKHFNNS